ncbi:MAG: DNA-directed RNA polymerase subunit alpha [Metamycoplasmataceae bacterium]
MSKLTKINYNEIKSERVSDNNTKFIISPLERGMANTLGTSLRRVLLSSVYGVSAFAIKISGIDYEYQIIEGLDLDVISLTSKLSKIKFFYDEEIFTSGQIFKISFKSAKEGSLKISDLVLPPQLKFADGTKLDTVIANLSGKREIEIELFVKSGRGYIDSELNKILISDRRADIESNIKDGKLIAVDSNFSPILKVSHKTEELHTSSYDVLEELQIEVETNGSISAKEALSQASKILMAHLSIIGNINNLDINEVFIQKEIKKEFSKFDSITIEDLDLNVRSLNGLRKANITKVSDLVKLSAADLRNINSIGEKSVVEIIQKLKEKNIDLARGDE